MANQTVIKASCLCLTSSFSFLIDTSSLPMKAHLCHCTICRRVTGSLCTLHAAVPAPSALEGLASYNSSDNVTRYFCTSCGCHMLDYAKSEGQWHIATGVVEKSEGVFEFKEHLFVTSTKDGGLSDWLLRIGGGLLKRWEGQPEVSEELSDDWQARTHSSPQAHKFAERLHVHCHCKGVEFHITRPDPAILVPQSRTVELGDSDTETYFTAVHKKKYLASNCACRSCRLSSGSDIVPWAFIPMSQVTLATGEPLPPVPAGEPFRAQNRRGSNTLKSYHSSAGITRSFCGCCGATVFYHTDKRPHIVDVAVGLLDAESGARAAEWLEWRSERVSFEEDAANRALVVGLKDGMKERGHGQQGRSGPLREFLEARESS